MPEALLVVDCLKYGGRLYAPTDEARNAVAQCEWAVGILSRPAVQWPTGDSHVIAGGVLDEFEDVLIDYLRVAA